jgi:NAD(P)H dehydrogenase (quinone)
MPKALVAFATQSGQTEKIANFIAAGLRESGVETVVISAAEIRTQADLEGYDVYVFGSATYHTKMMLGMTALLALAEKLNIEGNVGGSFGAFGWSGEASDRIFDAMSRLRINSMGSPLKLKSALVQGASDLAKDYAKALIRKIA